VTVKSCFLQLPLLVVEPEELTFLVSWRFVPNYKDSLSSGGVFGNELECFAMAEVNSVKTVDCLAAVVKRLGSLAVVYRDSACVQCDHGGPARVLLWTTLDVVG
jgi:hypothetical protein